MAVARPDQRGTYGWLVGRSSSGDDDGGRAAIVTPSQRHGRLERLPRALVRIGSRVGIVEGVPSMAGVVHVRFARWLTSS
jgi:hypothetical protein